MLRETEVVEGRGGAEGGPRALARSVAADVTAAAAGDHDAWVRIHDRYANLIWTIARAYHLGPADAADVCQTTWLRLAEHLNRIKEPSQVHRWLATTARREALRVQTRSRRIVAHDHCFEEVADTKEPRAEDSVVRREERGALREAFLSLPAPCRTLLRVLMAEPNPSYFEVSAALNIPVGSIGPRRARCLEKLRNSGALGGGRPAA